MEQFLKITVGFVIQTYQSNDQDQFVCIHQDFIAGDQVDFEDTEGNPIHPPDHPYQTFNMTLISGPQIINRINDVLTSLDVGGEQSRAFASEIGKLKNVLGQLEPLKQVFQKGG